MNFLNKNFPVLLSISLHLAALLFFVSPAKDTVQEAPVIDLTEVSISEGIGGPEGGGDGFPLPPEKKVFVNESKETVKEKKTKVTPPKKEPIVKQDDFTSGKEETTTSDRYGTGTGQGTGIGNKTGSGTGTGLPKEEKKVTPPPPVVESNVYIVGPEIRPEPIGGMQGIYARLVISEEAKTKGIKGEVLVRAFIDENGMVRKTQLLKGLGYGLDQAAANAIRKTRFKPGKQKGVNLKVQMDISISF